jgi:hypothetical protein
LFTYALAIGATIRSNGLYLIVEKEAGRVIFDHMIQSPSGYLLGMKTKPQTSEMAMAVSPKTTKI